MEEIELSVSIVNTNNRDLLRDCVKSIYEGTTQTRFEVIVVDNASTDGSVEMLQAQFPSVQVITNPVRSGYGFSHNRGVLASRGEFVLILNEDMIVLRGALDTMMEAIRRDPTIGALGCKLLTEHDTVQTSCARFPTLASHAFEALVPSRLFLGSKRRTLMYSWDHSQESDVDIITGSCMLMPRRVFDEVGRFDPQFFIYAEETDLCRRVWDHGYRVRFTPEAEIVHLGDQTTRTMSTKMYVTMIDSKCKYLVKHSGRSSALAFRAITAAKELTRLPGSLGCWIVTKGERRRRAKEGVLGHLKGLAFAAGLTSA